MDAGGWCALTSFLTDDPPTSAANQRPPPATRTLAAPASTLEPPCVKPLVVGTVYLLRWLNRKTAVTDSAVRLDCTNHDIVFTDTT